MKKKEKNKNLFEFSEGDFLKCAVYSRFLQKACWAFDRDPGGEALC